MQSFHRVIYLLIQWVIDIWLVRWLRVVKQMSLSHGANQISIQSWKIHVLSLDCSHFGNQCQFRQASLSYTTLSFCFLPVRSKRISSYHYLTSCCTPYMYSLFLLMTGAFTESHGQSFPCFGITKVVTKSTTENTQNGIQIKWSKTER